MYELNKVGNNTYYFSGPTKIGLYVRENNDAFLIDSGNDKDAGKRVLKVLDENGWNLKGIINTHSHADHIGGNNFLQEKTGCKIFAKGIERSFTLSPILEPAFLYGANPHSSLKHKFLLAKPSACQNIDCSDFPEELEIFDLSGHCFEMIGVKNPDNILFIADSVSSPVILAKYGISYIYDVKGFINTLEKLKSLNAMLFIPSHADVTKEISELVNINLAKVNEISDKIYHFLMKPCTFEKLLQFIFNEYNLIMTAEQYVLISSALKSYLTYLLENEKITYEFCENMCIYKSK